MENHGFVVGPLSVKPVNQHDTVILPETLTALDVHFISSLPVKQQPACMAWVDKRPAQIVEAES